MIDATMQVAIDQAIRQNLPTQVGQTLQAELARIPVIEADLAKVTKDRDARRDADAVLQQTTAQREANDKASAALRGREEAIVAERDLAVKTAVADAHIKHNADLLGIVAALASNNVVRTRLHGTENIVHPSSSGGTGWVEQRPIDRGSEVVG